MKAIPETVFFYSRVNNRRYLYSMYLVCCSP